MRSKRRDTQSNKSTRNRKLCIESLDTRCLMASDTSGSPDPAWSRFENESEAITKLVDIAVGKWGRFFGQSQSSLWYIHEPLDLFGLERGDFQFDALNLHALPINPTLVFSNDHVLGVNESDRIQISGDGMVYVLREGTLRIVDIRDADNLIEVGSMQFDSMHADMEMHLVRDKLVVVENGFGSVIHIVDVKDPKSPQKISSIKLDGSVVESRVVKGELLIVHQSNDLNPMPTTIPHPSVPLTAPIDFLLETDHYRSWGTYETKEEYVSRMKPMILETLLPNFEVFDKNNKFVSKGIIGNWEDIALSGDDVGYSVFTVNLQSDIPTFGDSSSVTLEQSDTRYITDKSVYFVSTDGVTSRIARVTLNSRDDVDAASIGTVPGQIRDSRMLDEYEGTLRVVANEFESFWTPTSSDSGNLYVLKEVEDRLVTIGKLLNVSPGERVYSVEFDGERAVLTTASVDLSTSFLFRDPLHGIDLSDPTNPLELSDLEIPGVTNYLHWIDDTHLVGIGLLEQASQWRLQVSLYDVEDLSNPRLVDVWSSESTVQNNLVSGLDVKAIHYDKATKTLIVPLDTMPDWTLTVSAETSKNLVFHVDPIAKNPLDLRSAIPRTQGVTRAFVIGDVILQMSGKSLESYDRTDPKNQRDFLLVANPLNPDFLSLHNGEKQAILDVLANDEFVSSASIIRVEGGLPGSQIKILANNKLEYVTAPSSEPSEHHSHYWTDFFTYTVKMANGSEYTAQVRVWGCPLRELEEVPKPNDDVSDARAWLRVVATDDEGNIVTSIEKGDEVWIELQAEDLRDQPQGVYAAYADLVFDTKAFEVVGEVEAQGVFTQVKRGERTRDGWVGLGAVSESLTPTGVGVQSIVRFRLKALSDDDLVVSIVSSKVTGQETLLYGLNAAISHENLFLGGLSLSAPQASQIAKQEAVATSEPSRQQLDRMDIDDDGWVSPLDSLMVINQINAELSQASRSSVMHMDIDQDGRISMLDALMLINQINSAQGAINIDAFFAEGEGEFSDSESNLQRRATRVRRSR